MNVGKVQFACDLGKHCSYRKGKYNYQAVVTVPNSYKETGTRQQHHYHFQVQGDLYNDDGFVNHCPHDLMSFSI